MKDTLYRFAATTIYLDGKVIEKCQGDNILCLAHLVSKKMLPREASMETSAFYFESLANGCEDCPYVEDCALCMVNE